MADIYQDRSGTGRTSQNLKIIILEVAYHESSIFSLIRAMTEPTIVHFRNTIFILPPTFLNFLLSFLKTLKNKAWLKVILMIPSFKSGLK